MQLNALGFGDNKCSSASVKLYSAAWFGVFFNSEVLNFAGCSYGEDYIYVYIKYTLLVINYINYNIYVLFKE